METIKELVTNELQKNVEEQLHELSEFQLALVGGGIAEVILG